MKQTRRELLAAAAQLPVLLLAAYPATRLMAMPAIAFTDHQAATLIRIAWLQFPFEGLADEPYERAVLALSIRPEVMADGVAALDQLAQGRFLDLPEDRQVALLQEMQASDFFITALDAARVSVLHDRELWKLIGYEGSSLEFGGYLDHGLEDISWLPAFPDAEGAGHE